ncbi:MAG: RNA polymerase sigma factor [Cytophagaceae bacterium]
MDKGKFISVVKEHRNLIFKICNSYCSDPESRKDLQQEILIQLWNSFSRFDGRIKLSTWIYRIALNTAISFYRSNRKHNNHQSLDASIIILSESECFSENDENIQQLYQLINHLNELERALILLYLDDIKYKDIAEILGISETNVATKISRIKKKLKEQFNQDKTYGTK